MNNEIFQQARSEYDAKNYEAALAAFTQCLKDYANPLAPGEMGLLYHQIGNCLVKIGDANEAIHAYSQATADSAYDAVGAVNYNLGMAYAALHDYEDAVKHFEIAVSDAKYDTPYKAYSSMGSALMKLGKSAEAGVAFRQAALDEGNPDPTKALLNLGVCFMALDRPADAVSSYESALQFPMNQATKNKLCANLGQAYVASNQMQKAVTAFESALADKTYFLSDSASVDYQRAVAEVASGPADTTASLVPLNADMSGLDVTADGAPVYPVDDSAMMYGQDPYYYPEAYGDQAGYPPQDDRFFTQSDEELEQWSKGIAKQDRKRRNIGLKIIVFVFVLLLILFGASIFMYTQGYGFPQQDTVIQELFDDPQAAATTVFASDLDASKVQDMVDVTVTDQAISIDGMNKSMTESTAYVTAHTPEGAEVQYKVSLVRDGLGWKVSSVDIYNPSMN